MSFRLNIKDDTTSYHLRTARKLRNVSPWTPKGNSANDAALHSVFAVNSKRPSYDKTLKLQKTLISKTERNSGSFGKYHISSWKIWYVIWVLVLFYCRKTTNGKHFQKLRSQQFKKIPKMWNNSKTVRDNFDNILLPL